MYAPVLGWTSDESPVDASPGTALILDNWFPEPEAIRLRRGYAEHVRGMGPAVQTLMVYTSASASKMFAASGTRIYDVSSAGLIGSADVTGLTSAEWQHVNFANSAGQWLVAVNGVDAVRNYDGTTWTTPTITGTGLNSSSSFIAVTHHKFRLWFAQSGTTDLWYLDTNAIAGTAVKFPVGALLKRGGYVMALSTWSVDAGSGMDDLLAIWSSEGEVIVYQGVDPGDPTQWALVGVYTTGKPIGRRCMHPVGGDIAMLSEDGIVAISQLLKADRATVAGKALTAKIRQAYSDAVKRSRDSFGWQMVTHPIRSMALVNVPGSSAGTTVQFALNTLNGAWCRFTNMPALCWAVFDNEIYFGYDSAGRVYKADTGGQDDGDPIEAACLPSYSHLSARGRLKDVKMVQPIFSSEIATLAPSTTVAVDYELPTDITTGVNDVSGYFTWDVSTWDGPDVWFGSVIDLKWRGGGNIGVVISPYTTVSIDDDAAGADFKFRVYGWTIVYETGGVL